MTDLSMEVGVAISYGNISPFDIAKVLAGFSYIGNYGSDFGTVRSGFIIQMRSGIYKYISIKRDTMSHSAYVAGYREYPEWLLKDRAVPWSTDEDELNANLPQAKSEAKNGVTAGTFRPVIVGSVVRPDS